MTRNNKGQFTSDARPERRTGKILPCLRCGKERYVPKWWLATYKYCSDKCSNHKGESKNTGRTHFRKGFTPWNKETHIQNNTGRTHFKRGQMSGDKHHNWQGGKTSIAEKIRKSLDYEEWRNKILERDLYTCQDCGKVGGYLNVDHIKPFSLFPELRLDINNGRTLCIPCHKETKSYLNSHMKKEDFI